MRLPSWLRRRHLDEGDLEDEIRAHLAMAARDRMADGADEQSARLASLKDFGNVALTKEAARRVWIPGWLEAVHDQASDVRQAIRALSKKPLFSLTVVAVLTLGIGLNATVFTMLKGLALSPLAGVEGSARLNVVYGETGAGRAVSLSYPDYLSLRDRDSGFIELFGSAVGTMNLGRGRTARPIFVEIVTGNYFHALGVHAAAGRTLLPADDAAPGRDPVVVISGALWRRDFSGDPAIVGRTVEINNTRLTVVGVADPSFHGTIVSYDVEAFVPVTIAPQLGFTFGSHESTPSAILADRSATVLHPQGYLRREVTRAAAAARIGAIWSALSYDRPLAEAVQTLRVVPFWRFPDSAQMYMLPTLAVLSAMGLLVLAVACANIAGLVLVRGLSRRGEIAMRLALGATRARIVRLLIAEHLVLALPGALVGVALASRGILALVRYAEAMAAPARLFFNIGIDQLVIGFAVLVAAGCALLFGFVPALQASRIDLVSVINEDSSPRGAARGRFRAALVVAQVAVSLLLLVGAGLAARTVDAARGAYPGFDPTHTVDVALDLKLNGYDEARGRAFYKDLLQEMRRRPDVEAAAIAANAPMGFLDTRVYRVAVDGHAPRRGEDLAFMSNTISPDYFHTLRIPLVAGRGFEERDGVSGAPVAVVNQTFAERFWNGATKAIGKKIRVADGDWRTVVGVAADIKYSRINEPRRPYVYLPFLQAYRSSMTLHVRGSAPSTVLIDEARTRIAALDPELPVLSAWPLTEHVRGALTFFDLTATMLFVFGATGMALAAMGTYGLVSYIVTQSTHEIGIRMALGATGVRVVRSFVGRGVRLGAAGAALGIAAALTVTRLLSAVLYGVSATDAIAFGEAVAIVLAGVGAATLIPAWRAARLNPLAALRHR